MEPQGSSRKVDAPPLLYSGTEVIGFWQLDKLFYERFITWNEDAQRRKFLCGRLSAYLQELRKFSIQMEVWLDGSFTTTKIDPEDVDLAVFAHEADLMNLSPNRQKAFERLTMDREIIKALYQIDVYLGSLDRQEDLDIWTATFSRGHYEDKVKGFYKISLNNNV